MGRPCEPSRPLRLVRQRVGRAERGGDGEGGERHRRLIIVSAGNIPAETDFTRRRSQDEYPIEDPAQAWNALTIGGYTDRIDVTDEGYEDWSPLVEAGELSPHSRTSVTWPPIKPKLVMEAGNRAVNPAQTEILTVGSVSLLSTGNDVTREPLVMPPVAAIQVRRDGLALGFDASTLLGARGTN
jgi:hypothetical protein